VLACLLGRLRWRPDDIWRATPREIAFALGRGAPAGMNRTELRALLARFPDTGG